MLVEANDEIRREMEWAVNRRLARLRQREPFAYLDWVISELEEYHLRGWKRVPKAFLPSLLAIGEVQPSQVRLPERWPALIRDAIDRCFNIQEQLLTLRDPDRGAIRDAAAMPDYADELETAETQAIA